MRERERESGRENLQPFEIMDRFSGLPSGNFLLSLDHEEAASEAETLAETEADTILSFEVSSEANSISGDVVEVISVVSESSSELELVEINDVEIDLEPRFLSPQQENEHMREEERYGHFHRVQARHSAVQARLRRVSEAIANESPEERQVRRRLFYEAVHGVRPW